MIEHCVKSRKQEVKKDSNVCLKLGRQNHKIDTIPARASAILEAVDSESENQAAALYYLRKQVNIFNDSRITHMFFFVLKYSNIFFIHYIHTSYVIYEFKSLSKKKYQMVPSQIFKIIVLIKLSCIFLRTLPQLSKRLRAFKKFLAYFKNLRTSKLHWLRTRVLKFSNELFHIFIKNLKNYFIFCGTNTT